MQPIPWFSPQVGDEEKAAVAAVIESNYLNDGPVTRRLEAEIANRLGVRHCVGVTSGTAAITLALMALGVGPGDEVLVPDITFVATANAVRLAGASVRLVEVEPRRFTMDPAKVEAAIGPRTRAMVPVDINGRGADYRSLEELCRRHDLFLVCDAAESLGSSWGGRPLASYGHAACLSFSANKRVTTGQGGIVATNDDLVRDRLIELKDQGRRVQGSGGDDLHPAMGYNFKLTNLQAAVGLAQLGRLDERVAHSLRRDQLYRQALGDIGEIFFPPSDGPDEAPLWTDALFERRDVVRRALDAASIGYRGFWFPLHTQEPYRGDDRDFPVAVDVSRRGLWLPSDFRLTDDDIARTCDIIRAALRSA